MDKIIQADGKVIHLQRSLTREQKRSVGLLSLGTFLEYFDLMLYIHMAVLLNELFFPKTDAFTKSLVTATAISSSYFFRPLGALLFGWLGDNIGRKSTVIITTFMMALSCLVMATLPTYAQIGITASWVVTICRILQGVSSMGERIGAELYFTESIRPPIQYPTVSSVSIFAAVGSMAALGLASLALNYDFSWRVAFLIGAVVALVGSIARKALRESPDFADAKRRFKNAFKQHKEPFTSKEQEFISSDRLPFKAFLSLFLIQCLWPVGFYFSYIYCADILTKQFGYNTEQIINNNFIVSLFEVMRSIVVTFLSYYIFPLRIQKISIIIFTLIVLMCPYLLDNITTSYQLIIMQILFVVFAPSVAPGTPVFFKYFPVFKRFTSGSLAYAFAKMFMTIITSYGMIYLGKFFGNWGLLIIMSPACVGYYYGIVYFNSLETNKII